MEKERVREVKRVGGSAGRSPPPAKRQQRPLSGHITHPTASSCKPTPASVLNDRTSNGEIGGGSSEADGEMGGSGGGASDGEETLHPTTTNTAGTTTNLSSRKRVKPHAKALEDCSPVDHAAVPRRLRSAINKRSSQSASPPLSDAKRSNHHASCLNGVRRQKQNMFNDKITKDEVEVAETLSTLANMVLVSKSVEEKEDKRISQENSQTEAPASPSEASKEEATRLLLPCSGTEVTNPSSCLEESPKEAMKAEPSVTASGSQQIDQGSNEIAKIDIKRTPVIRNELVENTSSSDARKLLNDSNPLGASSEVYPANGVLQPIQLNAPSIGKPELGLGLSGGPEVHPAQQKSESCAGLVSREEATGARPRLWNHGHGHLTMSSSNKSALQPDIFGCVTRPSLTKKVLTTEKLPLTSADRRHTSADRRRSWSSCVTHVYISHLIKNHQNIEKKQHLLPPLNQLKVKEGTNVLVQTANGMVGPRNGINCMTSAGVNGYLTDRNLHEARIRMLQDGRLLQAQQSSTLSGTYAQPKQGCDFLALPGTGETVNPGNELNPPGHLSISYLHSQVKHHAVMPFPFPHGSYAFPYPDQLAIAATQQLPQFIGAPFYGSHMIHAGGTAKQHQQMLPAHLAHYRPQLGIPTWQNGRLLDPTLIPCAQPPPAIPLAPSIEGVGTARAYHPSDPPKHQLLPITSSSSSSRAKQQHLHRDGGGLGAEVPTQLRLICNAQRM